MDKHTIYPSMDGSSLGGEYGVKHQLACPGLEEGQPLTFSQLKEYCTGLLADEYREHGYEVTMAPYEGISFSVRLMHGIKNFVVGILTRDLDEAQVPERETSRKSAPVILSERYSKYGEFPVCAQFSIYRGYDAEDSRLVQGCRTYVKVSTYSLVPDDDPQDMKPVDGERLYDHFLYGVKWMAEQETKKGCIGKGGHDFSDCVAPDVRVRISGEYDPILTRSELMRRLETEMRAHPQSWNSVEFIRIHTRRSWSDPYALYVGRSLNEVSFDWKDGRISSITVRKDLDSLTVDCMSPSEGISTVMSPQLSASGSLIDDDVVRAARSCVDEYVRSRGLDIWGFRWLDAPEHMLRFSFKEMTFDVSVVLYGDDLTIKAMSRPFAEDTSQEGHYPEVSDYAVPLWEGSLEPVLGGIHVGSRIWRCEGLTLIDLESDLYPIGVPMCVLDTDPFAVSGSRYIEAVDMMCSDAREGLQIGGWNSMVQGCDFSRVMQTLRHVKVCEGYVLDVFGCGPGSDGSCDLYARRADAVEPYRPGDVDAEKLLRGEMSVGGGKPEPYSDDKIIAEDISWRAAETIPDWTGYVEYDFNEESVWEMFLLHVCKSRLPYKWHGGYGVCKWFFSSGDFINDHPKETLPFMRTEAVVPRVQILSAGKALVRACHWNDWRGLACDEILVSRNGDGTTSFSIFRRRTLVHYDCGIKF